MSQAAKPRMWGGRFVQEVDASFDAFQRSFGFDCRLLSYELAVDRAWARALVPAGILSAEERDKLLEALDELEQRGQRESAASSAEFEDVHHFVEAQLIERLGPLGAKLHTGRSRNELIVTDFRLFMMDAAQAAHRALTALVAALLGQAERHLDVAMPGQTHLQHAQPILFSHFLLAHAQAFLRDRERVAAAAKQADACPLGSGALAGCPFPIDREGLARELGFTRITANSLDAVGDRDFALEYLFALAVTAMHLSRLAEDFALMASSEFGFVILPDEFSTGSSLMPQKRNPDVWELVRGKSGRITGALVSLLVTMKGLASSYQRDLQEDKEPLFAAHDQALAMLQVAAGALAATRINPERMHRAAADPAMLSTEGADYLVARGVPFRQAHEIMGAVVREGERLGKDWRTLPLETLKRFSPAFEADWASAVTLESSLHRRCVAGSTAPETVRAALAECRASLQKDAAE